MEYYCTKDKNIAFKILDLGLKRFKHQPDYLLAYVEFLTQLNEDNNTRVLFERYIIKSILRIIVFIYVLNWFFRILSSGSLSPENSLEIWNRFLEFESSIGDLTSVVKVEKRRNVVLDKVMCSNYIIQNLIVLIIYFFYSLRNWRAKKQPF